MNATTMADTRAGSTSPILLIVLVVLGGAGLAGLAGAIAADVPVPVLDSLDCTVRQAIALARGAPTKPATGSYAAPPPVPAEGLSPPLAAMLDARRTSGGA